MAAKTIGAEQKKRSPVVAEMFCMIDFWTPPQRKWISTNFYSVTDKTTLSLCATAKRHTLSVQQQNDTYSLCHSLELPPEEFVGYPYSNKSQRVSLCNSLERRPVDERFWRPSLALCEASAKRANVASRLNSEMRLRKG